ncbi:amino acid ABC transporter permease [Nonomuraea sp. NBC_01738]|uniref:amino acid ABC transporter permease n=1 Tax=Nonomuraea sp. NBC_01738 TaxID=2976003 RepID=UPI002E163B56|nr:amino acid ABC transporter permease [Nonomuraea sp. NBC_01738]
MSSGEATVLYDAPGPKARARNMLYTFLASAALLAVIGFIVFKLNDKGQFKGEIWAPFLVGETWTEYLIPGLMGTLTAAALAAVFALLFGSIFGLARLSDHRWIRVPAGIVVDVFRAIPLLLLIFFIWFLMPSLVGGGDFLLFALVAGLTLYNGSVLAEVVRAGVQAVPRGQAEAAYAIGLRKSGVMRRILLPQALTAMMPAVVSQLVVLLKDTALGYIITYVDLLNMGFKILPSVHFGTKLVSALFIGVIYIGLNMLLSWFATWLEKRSRRSRKTSAKPLPKTLDLGNPLGG